MSSLNPVNITLPTLPILPTLIPHIPYPHHITEIPRPSLSPRDLNAADATNATNADAAFPVTSRYQRTEYLGYPVTWITKTRTIFDIDRDEIPDYLTRRIGARDVTGETGAAVNTMVSRDGNGGNFTIDNIENEESDTPDLFDRLASAAHLTESYGYRYPDIYTMPGPVVPSTFATVTLTPPNQNPSHLNHPRENPVPSKCLTTKLDTTFTAVVWTTLWIPGPDTTRTQEATITLETGLVLPTTEANGQDVVTLEVEGSGFEGRGEESGE